MSREGKSEKWWRRTTGMSLGHWVLHLGLTWDVVNKYHFDGVGYFIWDLFETSWRRTDGMSLLLRLEASWKHFNTTLQRRTTDTSWWRSNETSLIVSFETYLQRCWNVQRNVAMMSSQRLFAGWGLTLSYWLHFIVSLV